MSQYKKDQVDLRILKAAKSVFLKHGYQNSGLRVICNSAKISLSNLYNYYPNKDALFSAVLTPLLNDIEKIFEYGKSYRTNQKPFEKIEDKKQNIKFALDYITQHKYDLKLLFKLSAGSKLENYSDYLSREYQNNWNLFFDNLKDKSPNDQFKKPSDLFIQMMASFLIASVIKIIDQDLKENELENLMDEISLFFWHGGMGLVNNLK